MSEKMREDFQNWLSDEHELNSEWLEDRNCFKDYSAHIAYKAWIASRAALCVELPERESMKFCPATSADYDAGFDHGQSQSRADFVAAIHAAGVSTK